MQLRASVLVLQATLLVVAVSFLTRPVAAQPASVDAGFISIWQDLTNTSAIVERIPRNYRFPVCRVIARAEVLTGLTEFGPAACPTPLADPSVRGGASLILRDLTTDDLDSKGRLTVRFIVERADGSEEELAEFYSASGSARGLMPWAAMNLRRGDLIVAQLRVQGAVRRLAEEEVILLVTFGS